MATPQKLRMSLRRADSLLGKTSVRTFTSSQQCRRGTGMGRQLSRQDSITSKMASMKGTDIPDDIGLMPDLLLRPAAKDLPSVLSVRRLRIERRLLAQRIQDFVRLMIAKKWTGRPDEKTGKTRRLPLSMGERYIAARNLHSVFYGAIAERNTKAIEEIACTGVKRQAHVRIANKKHLNAPTEHLSVRYRGLTFSRLPWWLQMLIPPQFKSSQILADREGSVPIGENNTMRQVVVRLKSTQTLSKDDGTSQESFDKDEYVVIQRMNINGEEGPWKIWGTLEGSSSKQIDQVLKSVKENGVWAKFKQQYPAMFGSTGSSALP